MKDCHSAGSEQQIADSPLLVEVFSSHYMGEASRAHYKLLAILQLLFQLVAMVLTQDGSCSSNLQSETRIPYIVSVRQLGSRSHVCSGILITADLVLTAAHCVDEGSVYSAGKRPIVHVGPTSVDDVSEEVEVKLVLESYIHPKWDHRQRSAYNVALLRLENSSKKQFPVVLSEHFRVRTGMQLTAVGFGAGGEEINVGSDIFGPVKLETQELIEQQQCNRPTLWNNTVPEGMLCGLNVGQRSSCLVDSGAPLLLLDQPQNHLNKGRPELDYLIGLNVDGSPCGTPKKADLFISVEHVQDWIAEMTSK